MRPGVFSEIRLRSIGLLESLGETLCASHMRLPRDIFCAHENRFRIDLRHCVYSRYAAIKSLVLRGAFVLVLIAWTGPGHQELVSCLAVKNESLYRINLCMRMIDSSARNHQKIIVDAYSVFAGET